MKPCPYYQKLLALHAAATLTGSEEIKVRDHLRGCAACGEYLKSLSSLAADHRHVARELPAFAAQPGFYQRISRQIHGKEGWGQSSAGSGPARLWSVRIAGAVSALALVGWALLFSRPRNSPEVGNISPNAVPSLANHKQSDSSHIVYRLALNRSFEEFEQLLTQTATRHIAFREPHRASREALADPGL